MEEDYRENFIFYRDFQTTHSAIPLKAGGTITVSMGYKIFKSVDYTRPEWFGFAEDMEWILLEKGGALSGFALGFAATLVTLMSF